MQALVQTSSAVIGNVVDEKDKEIKMKKTERDKKDISQTMKGSIHKCADAEVFLGKINQDNLSFKF